MLNYHWGWLRVARYSTFYANVLYISTCPYPFTFSSRLQNATYCLLLIWSFATSPGAWNIPVDHGNNHLKNMNLQSLQHESLPWDTLTLDAPLPHHTSGTWRWINESIRNSCDQETPQICPWTWGILRGWGKESLLLSRLLGVESMQLGRWHLSDDPPK